MKHYSCIDGFATMEEQGELFKLLTKGFEKDYKPRIAEIGVYKGRAAVVCN